MNIIKLSIFVFCTIVATNVLAETKFYPPKYPWHLADVWWKADIETENFREISVDFEIIGRLADGVSLYIAPVGLGKLNGTSFYGGIQTNSGGWKTKESRKIIKFGKGGIFSRWSKDGNPISLDYAQGNATTHFESAGYEGNFVSVRNKIPWNEGTYKYSVRKLKTVNASGKSYTWFGAYLYDYAKKQEYYIGSLKFMGSTFKYGKSHAAFVEVYGSKSEIPQITVIFDDPRINEVKENFKTTTIYYPDNGYKSKDLSRYAYFQHGNNKVVIVSIPKGLNDGVSRERYYYSKENK